MMMARTKKDSKTYWKEREIDHAKNVLKDDQKAMKEVAALYRDTSKEIEKEVNTMLSNYATKNELSFADVKKTASQTDIRDFESKAARYVKEKNFSARANQEMADYNLKMKLSRLELIQHQIDLELIAMTDGVESLTYQRLVNVGMEEVQRQAGILGETIRVNRKDIDFIARRQFHGDDFSGNLWKNKNKLHDQLNKRLTESITKGQHPYEAARKLRQEINQSVFNTERIMVTETARVQSESQLMSFEDLGIEQYQFVVTETACEVCLPLDDEIFNVKDGMAGENMPPLHPFCHCSITSYFDRDAFDKDLKSRGL